MNAENVTIIKTKKGEVDCVNLFKQDAADLMFRLEKYTPPVFHKCLLNAYEKAHAKQAVIMELKLRNMSFKMETGV